MREPKQYKAIMVSSTFEDLKSHRQKVIEAIEGLDFKPNVMEHSGARADLDVLEISLEMVRDSAAYIGVISLRYGEPPQSRARNPRRLSLTELEFNEAMRLQRPILMFMMSEDHPLKARDIETDPKKKKKLEAFRTRAKRMQRGSKIQRVYQEFASLKQFFGVVPIAIGNLKAYMNGKHGGHQKATGRLMIKPKKTVIEKTKEKVSRFPSYPYRGGDILGISDGDIYFGREAEVDELLVRLRRPETRLQCIQGPSGVGKSSLLAAGLLYRIVHQQALGGELIWSYSLFRPGDADPFTALMLSLVCPDGDQQGGRRGEIARDLSTAAKLGIDAVEHALTEALMSRLPGGTSSRLIVAVDQFEEVWTRAPQFANAFLTFIAAAERNPYIIVLLTLRDDFAGEFMKSQWIAPILRRPLSFQYPLAPPRVEQIEEIVRRPQRIAGVRLSFEKGFIQRVAADGHRLGETALPIVALLLQNLRYDLESKRVRERFTLADYERLGGLDGVVAILAKAGSEGASPALVHALFERLIEFKDRRPLILEARREDLLSLGGEMERLVEGLIKVRLLYASNVRGISSVRLFHEALTIRWKELSDWIQRNEFALSMRDRLQRDADLWSRRGGHHSDVTLGVEQLSELDEQLASVPQLLDSRGTIQAYLRACRVRISKRELIVAIKSGHLTLAFAAIKKMRKLEIDSFLDLEDKGDEIYQIKPAFWAAITGDDRTTAAISNDTGRTPKVTDEDGPSLFEGDKGKEEIARTTGSGLTPLCWAAFAGQEKLVRKLIRLGANPAVLDDRGGTPIHAAAIGGSLSVIKYLVEEVGVDPLKCEMDGSPPIIWSIQERHTDVVDYLVKQGQPLYFSTPNGFNALTEAARASDGDLVRKLVESYGYDRNCVTRDGQTALHIACGSDRTGSIEAAEILIKEFGANPLAKTEGGYTTLHRAATEGKAAVMGLLVSEAERLGRRDELVNSTCDFGATALHEAVKARRWSAVERLLSEDIGAKLDLTDTHGDTPLGDAVWGYDRRSAQLLLDHGANANVHAPPSWPPLLLAADNGDVDMVERLIKAKGGINLDITVPPGWTALMVAARRNRLEVVETLLAAGASADFANERGQDVLSIAQFAKNDRLVERIKGWAQGRPEMAGVLSRLGARTVRQAMDETANTETHEDPTGNQNGLIMAAASNDVTSVRSLLTDNTDPDAVSTALQTAASLGHDDAVELLLLESSHDDETLAAAAATAAGWGRLSTAQLLVKYGARTPPIWARPRISEAAHFLTFAKLTDSEREALLPRMKTLDPYILDPAQRVLRRTALTFFPGCLLIAFENGDAPGQNEQFAIEPPEGPLIALNWKNEPIYSLAETYTPDFSDAGLMLYCRFFFHWVRGSYGPFTLVGGVDKIRWETRPSRKLLEKVASQLIPLRIIDRASDHIRLISTLLFKNALFKSDILMATQESDLVDPESGEKEHFTMGQFKLLNEQLLIENLPVPMMGSPGLFG